MLGTSIQAFIIIIITIIIIIINFLRTEREGRTGEYWPEVVAARATMARLVSSLSYGFLITFCFVFASRNRPVGITGNYYMALSHEDWELQNSRI